MRGGEGRFEVYYDPERGGRKEPWAEISHFWHKIMMGTPLNLAGHIPRNISKADELVRAKETEVVIAGIANLVPLQMAANLLIPDFTQKGAIDFYSYETILALFPKGSRGVNLKIETTSETVMGHLSQWENIIVFDRENDQLYKLRNYRFGLQNFP